jgi:hypothetical protein
MNNRISITHVSNAHNEWLRSLDFYKAELTILRGRLTEIAGKNTATDALQQVEHFENQFLIQIDNIDRLVHDIKANLSGISHQAVSSSAGYIDGALVESHNELSQKVKTEEGIINNLRHEFNGFAAIWM